MNNKALNRLAALTITGGLFAANATFAQVSADGMGKILPVELYACSFVDGKGQSDLDAVLAQFNEFMDAENVSDYAAWQLTPYFYGPAQSYDMLWMGVFTDGNAMGRGFHRWITKGRDAAAAFDEVVQCGAHIGLSSAMYRPPAAKETSGPMIMSLSDCEMNEGTRYSDVRSAELAWAGYAEENDMNVGTYHWFPSVGDGNQDYDYKLLSVYMDFEAMGADWEMLANGGGRGASDDIFGDLDECNDARVYLANTVRAARLRD